MGLIFTDTDRLLNKLTTNILSTAFSYQQITVSGSIQKLTVPAGAKAATIIVESTTPTVIVARILNNGSSAVSSGVGIPVKEGTSFEIIGTSNLFGFQIIQEGAYATKINVEYYK